MQIAMTATISLGLFVIGHAAFAEDTTSFAKIDVVYHSSTNTLDVTGIVYKTFSQNYALTIFDPQGRLIVVSQLQLSQDNAFSQSIIPSSALWSESGNYTVKLASGPEMLSEKSFYFSGIYCCVPNSHGVQASLSGTTNVIDSPLKQFKSGIKAQDVKCNTGFILVLKQDYASACIKEPSAIKLFLRGWIFGFADYQPVYFMKHNIHAEISVKYSPSNHGSMSSDLLDLYPRAYSKTNSNYPTDAIYANANPDMISQNAETVVKYTIMAQNNTRGVYWLSLDNMCELVPIAVDVDKSNLTISDLQSPTTAWKCPGSTIQYHVIDASGVTVGLVPIRN